MSTHRIAQVDALIQRELSNTIRRVLDLPEGCLVTIEQVTTARDLSRTKVFVSVFPFPRRKEMLKVLQDARVEIQAEIAKKLVLRVLPKLVFVLDEREERADRINRLLDVS